MEKIINLSILFVFLCEFALSQDIDHSKGGAFMKKIEYSIRSTDGMKESIVYITDNKSTMDKLFFGETNSYVEFLFGTSFDGIYGLRIVQGTSKNNYSLEAMYLSEPDYREANRILSRYENPILIPYELQDSIPMKVKTLINEYNKNRPRILAEKDVYKAYRPETKSVNISGRFAEKLHDKISLLINNFKTDDIPVGIIEDGERVIFRCVVGNELWTLDIQDPQRRALKLSEICVQMIKEADKGGIDESKYIKLLD